MTNFGGTPTGLITRERVLRWGPGLVGVCWRPWPEGC